MSERIRQLEDALAILQSSVSQEPHPLLRDELLSLKVDKAAEVVDSDLSHDLPAGLDGLGTLSITDKGQRFFGASGGPEVSALSRCPVYNHAQPLTLHGFSFFSSCSSKMRTMRESVHQVSAEVLPFLNPRRHPMDSHPTRPRASRTPTRAGRRACPRGSTRASAVASPAR